MEAVLRRAKRIRALALSVSYDDIGQGLGEYGIILGLIAAACIVAVGFIGGSIQGMLSNVGHSGL